MRTFAMLALAAIGTLGLTASTHGDAQAKSLSIRMIDADLVNLPFGKNVQDTLKWVRAGLERFYAPKLKRAVSPSERQRLRDEITKEVRQIKKSLVHFKGQKTGLEASVVFKEYHQEVGESALVYQVGPQKSYLFFVAGKLYKYVRPLDPKITFIERVKMLGKDFGAPSSLNGGENATATWLGDRVRVVIRTARRVYGTDVLKVEDIKLAKTRKPPKKVEEEGVDPDLADIVDPDADSWEDEADGKAKKKKRKKKKRKK